MFLRPFRAILSTKCELHEERMSMNIITLPDPLLREVCEPVEIGDKSIKKLARDMAKLMYQTDGVGIAAPQVGLLKRFVVIDCDWVEEDEKGRPLKKNAITMINPRIIDHSETTVVNSEGCLSVPGISGDVERWEWVEVECYNENYELVRYKSDGLFGRCMQHELDHLDGKTFVDRMLPLARLQALKEYDEARARGARPGEVR